MASCAFCNRIQQTQNWPNADSMLVHRRRRWTNIESTLGHTFLACWACAARWKPVCTGLVDCVAMGIGNMKMLTVKCIYGVLVDRQGMEQTERGRGWIGACRSRPAVMDAIPAWQPGRICRGQTRPVFFAIDWTRGRVWPVPRAFNTRRLADTGAVSEGHSTNCVFYNTKENTFYYRPLSPIKINSIGV